jgi:hypothetical protein
MQNKSDIGIYSLMAIRTNILLENFIQLQREFYGLYRPEKINYLGKLSYLEGGHIVNI